MDLIALQSSPSLFSWWAVTEPLTHPRWRHLWRELVCGLPPIGRGGEWVDCTLWKNHGYLEGVTLPGCWVDGDRAWALEYDGAAIRVRVYDHDSLDMVNAISIDAWVYPHETNGVVIAAKRDAGNYAWQLQITADPNNKLEFTINAAGNVATSALSIPENEWTHVMGTYDRQNIRVLVNGKEDGSAAYAAAIGVNAVDVTLGSNLTAAPAWYDGLMTTARLWSRKLTELEGKELYDSLYGMYQLYMGLPFVTNHMGRVVYPIQEGMGSWLDAGSVTKAEMSSIDRGSGAHVYPIQPGMATWLDVGPVTKNEISSMARGNPLYPFNANVRGFLKRLDKKRKGIWK